MRLRSILSPYFAGISHTRKPTRPSSSTSSVGVVGRRGKRKRPPVDEDEDEDGDDDAFMEGGGESVERAMMVEGRERYVNGLLKQLIKVCQAGYMCLFVQHMYV